MLISLKMQVMTRTMKITLFQNFDIKEHVCRISLRQAPD